MRIIYAFPCIYYFNLTNVTNYTANYSDTWPYSVWLVNKCYVSMMSLGIHVLGKAQQLYPWWVLYDVVQHGDDKVKYWNDFFVAIQGEKLTLTANLCSIHAIFTDKIFLDLGNP